MFHYSSICATFIVKNPAQKHQLKKDNGIYESINSVAVWKQKHIFRGLSRVVQGRMRDKTFYSIFVGGYKLSRSAFQTIDLEGYICSICEALSDKVYKEY